MKVLIGSDESEEATPGSDPETIVLVARPVERFAGRG